MLVEVFQYNFGHFFFMSSQYDLHGITCPLKSHKTMYSENYASLYTELTEQEEYT